MNKKRVSILGALLGYGVIAFVLWFPVIEVLPDAIPGMGGDPIQTVWRIVRMKQGIPEGSIVVPEESSFPNLAPLPWVPLSFLFNEQVAYTVAWFMAAILAGWFTFLTARAWGASFIISFLAGVLVMLSPYRLAHGLGHFGAMQIWWLSAALYFGTRFIQTKRTLWGIALGLSAIGTIWTEHHMFIALMIIGAILGILYRKTLFTITHKRPFLVLGVILAVVIIGIGPFMTAVRQTATPDSSFNLGNEQRERYSATIVSLFKPAPFLFIRGGTTADYSANKRAVADHLHTVGMLLPLLAVFLGVQAIRAKKKRRLTISLFLIAATGLILALGPKIVIGTVSIPLPGALFEYVPILSAMRTMGRFVGLSVIALPLIVAVHWNSIRLRWVGAGLAVLLVLEVFPTFGYPTVSIPDKTIADSISNLPDGAILSIPGHTDYTAASRDLYLSAFHDKTLRGNIALARVFPITDPLLIKTPVVGDLLAMRFDELFTPTLFSQRPKDIASVAFRSQGVSGVIINTNNIEDTSAEPARAFLQNSLGLSEIEVTPGVFMYNTTEIPLTSTAFAIPGDGWAIPDRTDDDRMVSVQDGAEIHLYSSTNGPIQARLILDGEVERFKDIPQGFSTHVVHVQSEELSTENLHFSVVNEIR